jgi:hypothetical protein
LTFILILSVWELQKLRMVAEHNVAQRSRFHGFFFESYHASTVNNKSYALNFCHENCKRLTDFCLAKLSSNVSCANFNTRPLDVAGK